MKNILAQSGFYKWSLTMLVVLFPFFAQAQTDTLLFYNFSSSCAAPPSGWTIQNVDGGCTWRCSGGIIQNNHTSQGCTGVADDWLITPQLDFDMVISDIVRFTYSSSFNGGPLYLKFSSNYSGSGSPTSATWTTLGTYSANGAGGLQSININNYSGKGYLALHYTSTGNATNQAALYTVTNFGVFGDKSLYATSPSVTNITDSSATIGATIGNSGFSTITGRGIVWSTTANPLKNGTGVKDSAIAGTIGTFALAFNGLPAGTRIYFKGYVSDSSKTYYSSEVSFFTLSKEPAAYPTTFTATASSKNSIDLKWTQVAGANGYLILQRLGDTSTGMPVDGTTYAVNNTIGDGSVVAFKTLANDTTITINNLLQGTRYYYTLFPYNFNGVNPETRNYLTNTPLSVATDSTWGYPTSRNSILFGVAGTGDSLILSTINDAVVNDTNKGTLNWRLQLRDGGIAMNDSDDLPTIVSTIVLRFGVGNTVANWAATIQSVGLFDDSTGALIRQGTIGANTLTFSSLNITAQDNNYRPISLRLSLRSVAHTERTRFVFKADNVDVIAATTLTSSQVGSFTTSSDTTKNIIDVKATRFIYNTTVTTPTEVGVYIAQQRVTAVDTFSSIDIDFAGPVTISSIGNNLMGGARTVNAVAGIANFDSLRFDVPSASDTLIVMSTGLTHVKSNRFVIEVSKRSDIVADGKFAYPQNIQHLSYKDSATITTTNSLEVFKMYLRDGGAAGDPDFDSTKLTQLSFSVANPYLLSKVALYANNVKVGEISNVTTSITFPNFLAIAPDNDSIPLSLRVVFKDSAVDGHRLQFTVSSAIVSTVRSSAFAISNAGDATSSLFSTDNVIDIRATKLAFVKQPVNVAQGSIMFPYPTIKATDAIGNIDISGRVITVDAQGTTLNYQAKNIVAITSVPGVAELSKLIFDVPATGARITARSTGLDSTISNTFNVMLPTWFRSVQSGNWTDLATWEQSSDFGTNWAAASVSPNYAIHGFVTIQTGDTVLMDGITAAENTVDELTIENGAVLLTPQTGSLKLAVNDAFGDDVTVFGRLVHNNPQAPAGLDMINQASMRVVKGGVIELASFGDAAEWAGNPNIWFEDSATYLHNTPLAHTIGAATMFPNATETEVPIFRIGQNYTYPGTLVNAAATLEIKGLLSIDTNKSLTVGGTGERLLRNGISGAGNILLNTSAKTRITGKAQLSGTGKIFVNNISAFFQIAPGSYTTLYNNKEINTTVIAKNGIVIGGTLNGLTHEFFGTAKTTIEANATIITAHPQGIDSLFGNTGGKVFNQNANYEFNGAVAQTTGTITGNTARTLRVSNPMGVTLSDSISVSDTVFMGNGNITTSPAALLEVAGIIQGYSATSYVNGPLSLWVDTIGITTFPIGKTTYAPVNYSKITGSYITLEYVNNNPTTDGFDITKRGAGLSTVNNKEYWKITNPSGQLGFIEIPYTTNSGTTGVDTLNIRVLSWDGTKWVSEGPKRRTASATSVTSDMLVNNTVFTIGVDSACTVPANPAFTTLNVCMGSPANLTATGTGTIRWFVNNTDETPLAVGNTVNAGVILTDTTFYTEVKNIGCYSNRLAYPVKINAIPVSPLVTGATQLCYNAQTELAADTAGNHNWFGDINGTTPAFTGDVFKSANLTKDTTFYVEKVENGCPSVRTPVDVAVRALIQNPISNGAQACAGNPVTIKAAANEDIRWFRNNTTTTPFFTGEKYTTVTLFADSTFYLEAFEGACKSQRVPVLADILALPAAPQLTQPAVCEGNSVQINATATGKVLWYNDNTATIPADSGLTFTTPNLMTSRTYFANVFDGNCFSPRASATVSVYAIPVNVAFTLAANLPANQTTLIQTTTVAQNYEWNFGTDATPATAVGVGPHTVKWSTQGTKTISMKVWNGTGAVACSTQTQNNVLIGAGVGIEGVDAINAAVYPNPIENGDLIITTVDVDKATITVMDATGRQLYNGVVNGNQATVNVDGWAAGIYFVTIQGANFTQTVKINKL